MGREGHSRAERRTNWALGGEHTVTHMANVASALRVVPMTVLHGVTLLNLHLMNWY